MSSSKPVTSAAHKLGIWAFQGRVSTLLFRWNAVNIGVGLIAVTQGVFWLGFGSQAIGWGLINWTIAGVGSYFGRKRRAKLPNPDNLVVFHKERTSLRNILAANWALDMLYVLGGWLLFRGAEPTDFMRAGIGAGIMLQGVLLFIFDSLMLREVIALKPVSAEDGHDEVNDLKVGDNAAAR